MFGRRTGRHPLDGKVDDHDPVLLHNAHQHEHADEGIERRLLAEQIQRQESPHERCRQGRQHGQRVQVALVENGQNHVHDEHGQRHQDGQIADRVAERQGLTLQAPTHGRWDDLRGGLVDEVSSFTNSDPRLEVEVERHARELIQVIHRLGAW